MVVNFSEIKSANIDEPTLRRNMAVNCSEIRLNSSWMAVEFPTKVADILRPRGGMSQTAVLTLLGIHSTK